MLCSASGKRNVTAAWQGGEVRQTLVCTHGETLSDAEVTFHQRYGRRQVRQQGAESAKKWRYTFDGQARHMTEPSSKTLEARLGEAQQEIASLATSLQEQRRRATLMDAELFQLREAREDLEQRLAVARAEAEASQARRTEMVRVIEARDEKIQACYQEMATLERYILRLSAGGPMARLFGRLSGRRGG